MQKSLNVHELRLARRALVRWFDAHARPLPWRRAQTPYRVWVAEVMLQQTQVATVVPYFNRFLRAFPSLRSLARARRERVLEIWSGLGYYRRARDLHRAAQIVVSRFGSRFPPAYDAARSLPGVGDYTARAVLSIAFNQAHAVLDGNVARVVARWRALGGHIQQRRFRLGVERVLGDWLSRRRPGAFNQALMELGQTVCLPRAPRCPACPLAATCRAYRLGRPESFPAPRPRRPKEVRHLAVAAIRRAGKFALVRGLDENILPDLWNFPSAFGPSPAAARRALMAKLGHLCADAFSAPLSLDGTQNKLRHTISHRSIRVLVYAVEMSSVCSQSSIVRTCAQRTKDHGIKTDLPILRWLSPPGYDSAAVSALTRKIAGTLWRRLAPGPRIGEQRRRRSKTADATSDSGKINSTA